MNSDERVCLNGRIVAGADARIDPLDRGFLYGDGLFETMRVVAGRAFLLDRHLERLAGSCRLMGFGREIDRAGIAKDVGRLVEANGAREGYLRITVSRGPYRGGLAELAAEEPTVLIQARPMDLSPLEAPPSLALARSPYRLDEQSPITGHKSLSYQLNVLALAEARRRGADEAFFLNTAGHLAECAVSNLFFVAGGAVRTPAVSCGLLPGVTRAVVIELCGEEGLPVEEGAWGEEELCRAEEAFCTNSLRGVMGVERILDYEDAALRVGPVTRRLQRAYAALVRRTCG